ncbi:3-oxoacyl-[acyl-carrier-protein] reductase FabG-like [Mya arenaria]|uniref:3-oxoacyl-[acyl-carrier-protein] reductase FabG-like n=1 Tax=Mya arenaria TaxID=6604 RepID=UPI0022E94EF3|nr:3-oxoacyl-[acyl-carrier-protein] reductase FabG-like [Mya arenaria]
MDFFKGKVALITGASSGIGEGVALHLAGLGCRLSLTGRCGENLDRVAALCKEAGLTDAEILTIPADINNDVARKEIVEKTVDKYKDINVLINNAGMIHYRRVSNITPAEYDELFDTNVKSHVFLTQLALPHIIKTKGSIINTSSICGQKAMPEVGPYCMSKSCLDMFTQCLALEMAPHGVRVNAINPGTVVSNIARRLHGKYQDDELYQQFLETQASAHPLGRVALPGDCASAVAFLASDAASFITGQILFVDGGRNCIAAGVATNVKK